MHRMCVARSSDNIILNSVLCVYKINCLLQTKRLITLQKIHEIERYETDIFASQMS